MDIELKDPEATKVFHQAEALFNEISADIGAKQHMPQQLVQEAPRPQMPQQQQQFAPQPQQQIWNVNDFDYDDLMNLKLAAKKSKRSHKLQVLLI